MPIYEYRCGACGHEFEEWQKITDQPVRTCPKCHAKKVERLISATSFQLKGSGWYVTDYGRGGGGSGKKSKKPSNSGSGGGSGSSESSGGASSASSGAKGGSGVSAEAA